MEKVKALVGPLHLPEFMSFKEYIGSSGAYPWFDCHHRNKRKGLTMISNSVCITNFHYTCFRMVLMTDPFP